METTISRREHLRHAGTQKRPRWNEKKTQKKRRRDLAVNDLAEDGREKKKRLKVNVISSIARWMIEEDEANFVRFCYFLYSYSLSVLFSTTRSTKENEKKRSAIRKV